LLGAGATGSDAHTAARVAAFSAGRAYGLSTLLAGSVVAELHRATLSGFDADTAAIVAALKAFRTHGLAALLTPGDTELLRATLSRFDADAAALVTALLALLAGSRAAFCFLASSNGGGRADLGCASHAGFDAKVAGRVAADGSGLAHCVPTLALVGDAPSLAVDFQASGASGAPDRGTSDCVARAKVDWVAVNPGGDQEG
jgi:hypothetical protein